MIAWDSDDGEIVVRSAERHEDRIAEVLVGGEVREQDDVVRDSPERGIRDVDHDQTGDCAPNAPLSVPDADHRVAVQRENNAILHDAALENRLVARGRQAEPLHRDDVDGLRTPLQRTDQVATDVLIGEERDHDDKVSIMWTVTMTVPQPGKSGAPPQQLLARRNPRRELRFECVRSSFISSGTFRKVAVDFSPMAQEVGDDVVDVRKLECRVLVGDVFWCRPLEERPEDRLQCDHALADAKGPARLAESWCLGNRREWHDLKLT